MLRALDWKVPGEGILIRLVVDARDEDQVDDTPLKSTEGRLRRSVRRP
jgi:hypothetical protein